jgi:hypothetical protein
MTVKLAVAGAFHTGKQKKSSWQRHVLCQ